MNWQFIKKPNIFKTLVGLIMCSILTLTGAFFFFLDKAEAEGDVVNVRLTQIESKDFPEIQMYVSVTNKDGNAITDLTANDFELTEQSDLESFPVIENPLDIDFAANYSGMSIVLVIDRSGSMRAPIGVMEDVKDAVKNFIESLNFTKGNRIGIIDFDNNVTITQPFTYDQNLLMQAVDSLFPRDWSAVYDAIHTGVTEVIKETGIKAVIVLTDGCDNSSVRTKERIITYANDNNVPVYTVGVGGADENSLQEIANRTHAFYSSALAVFNLEAIYNDIAEKQGGQYLLTYTTHNPNFDGATRNVVVKAAKGGSSDKDTGTYLVGDELFVPQITLTSETEQLMEDSQYANQDLNISAVITDDVLVKEAKLFYRTANNNEIYKEVLMDNISGNLYQWTILGSEVKTPGIDFYITASDGVYTTTSPKRKSVITPYQITVLPNHKPNITETSVIKFTKGSPILVETKVVDRDGNDYVDWVKLYYRASGHILYHSVKMSNFSEDIFQAVIPVDFMGTDGIDYYIEASDSKGILERDGSDINPHHIEKFLFNVDYEEIAFGGADTMSCAKSDEPINLATGNYIFQKRDFIIVGKGLPFVFQRTYNSSDSYSGSLGAGWTHSYNVFLIENFDGIVKIKYEDGHSVYFEPVGGGNYQPKFGGYFDVLNKNSDNTFALTRKNQVKYKFNSFGKLDFIEDKNGNKITLEYSNHRLDRIIDTAARIISFQYENDKICGKITAIVDPVGRKIEFLYDENDNLLSSSDFDGNITAFTYDVNHRMTVIKDAKGNILANNDYDNQGKVIKQVNGRGFAWFFQYSTPGVGETTEIDAKGSETIYTHDAKYRLVKKTDAKGNFEEYVYDDNNNLTNFCGKNKNCYNFTYDNQGNLLEIINPLGDITTFQYDKNNNLLKKTDALENNLNLFYDQKGNLIEIVNAVGGHSFINYNTAGQIIEIIDARQNKITFDYDEKGNQINIKNALGNEQKFSYDEIGRQITKMDLNNNILFSLIYNNFDYVTKVIDPYNNFTEFIYNSLGRKESFIDANNNKTEYLYDKTNNLLGVVDAMEKKIEYNFDENGYKTKMIGANGNITEYIYNELGQLIALIDALGNKTEFAYDAEGNNTEQTDAMGNTAYYSYDKLNRLQKITYSDGKFVSFSYDKLGNRVQREDWTGIVKYTYDALQRLTKVVTQDNKTINYSYDLNGNRTQIIYPENKIVNYVFDKANRLSETRDWQGKSVKYYYDFKGNVIKTLYPNGIEVEYKYDANNRIITVINKNPEGEIISSFDYKYDADGNIAETKEELLDNGQMEIGKNGILNYQYDSADRIIVANDTTFLYNANGSLIEKKKSDSSSQYEYNSQQKLSAIKFLNQDDSVEQTVKFVYDADGNRAEKRVSSSNCNESVKYLYDINNTLPVIIEQSDARGSTSFVYGYGLISSISSGNKQVFYLYDGSGNVRHLTDEQGNVIANYNYDSFGNLLNNSTDSANSFTYNAQLFDKETGLFWLRSRYYDPEIGRFISKDIFPGFAQKPVSLNRYSYVYNNPINFDDPSGNWVVVDDVIVSGVGALGGLVSQYAGDVIGNVADGRGGFDVLKPNSHWKVYAVSFVGGAVTAEAALLAAPVGLAPLAVGVGSSATSLAKDWVMGEQPDFANAVINGGISGVTVGLLEQVPRIPGNWPNFFTKSFFAGKHTQNILLRKAVSIGINIDKTLIQNSFDIFSLLGYNSINSDK